MRTLYYLIVLLCISISMPLVAQNIYYVNAGATGNNDGSSWTDAFLNLTEALAAATDGDHIYMTTGIYKPGEVAATIYNNALTDRDRTFLITKNVHIYGGFTGNEATPDDRNPANFTQTILSGDLGIENDTSDNAYHVVVAAGKNNTDRISPTLDGVVITEGNANGRSNMIGSTIYSSHGGGMYNQYSSLTLTNVTICGNKAYNDGGGMYNNESDPALTNVIISENSAGYDGGGIMNKNSSPVLTSVTISGNNTTFYGGGMCNRVSDPTLTNSTISGNSASFGGGMYNDESDPTLTNVTFSGNSAKKGGGMHNSAFRATSTPTITNSIIWGNSAEEAGSNVHNSEGGNPTYSHSLIGGCGGSRSWNTDLGTDGGNNLDANPKFVGWINPSTSGWTATTDGDYRLYKSSPAIGTGEAGVNMGSYLREGVNDPDPLPDPVPEITYITISFTVDEGFSLQPSDISVSAEQGSSYTFYISLKDGFTGDPEVTIDNTPVEMEYNASEARWKYVLASANKDTEIKIDRNDEPPVANENPENALRFYTTDSGLIIQTTVPTPVTIYSITGSTVAQQLVEGQATFTLPQGIYIIRTDGEALKAVVR